MKCDLIRITSDYFCAGAELDPIHSTCINAAPIIKYMRNKSFKWIHSYCNKKNWKLEFKSSKKWNILNNENEWENVT